MSAVDTITNFLSGLFSTFIVSIVYYFFPIALFAFLLLVPFRLFLGAWRYGRSRWGSSHEKTDRVHEHPMRWKSPEAYRLIPAFIGIFANLVWVAVLFAICATDQGRWRTDRIQGCIFWCGLMAVPAMIAIAGTIRRTASYLSAAAIACIPLTLISLAGAGFPMIVPGILFYVSTIPRRAASDNVLA